MTAAVLLIWAVVGIAWSVVIWREVADMRSTPTPTTGRANPARIKTPEGRTLGVRLPLRAPNALAPKARK